MDESFENFNLDGFIIKDKEYRRNRMIKIIKIIVLVLFILVVLGGITYIVIKILTKDYGKIICKYLTIADNETTLLFFLNTHF